ncbi:type III secretion system outer membrane ring subunit SctC [Sphingomonas sp. MMS12-HWE2-04]|uniref:type III secretion system outer membrane ring subunit SctC n=1 Tax=Sphingomonas sp. MMS12-HWE2-04 TaxID=3234199 RepID=UPI00384D996D
MTLRAKMLFRSGLVLGGCLMMAAPVTAKLPPFGSKPVSLTARNQDIASFLSSFFSASGLTVVVGDGVTGKVNGRFAGPPAEVWAKLSRAFNLVAYYDGSIVTVYGANQVQSRTIAVPSGRASEVAANVEEQLGDATNRARSSSADALTATGVPRFLEQVQSLASGTPQQRYAQRPPIDRIAPGARGGGGEIEPYELRVFYLRYARADDTVLTAGNREVKVPGVGTTLSQIMGDGAPVSGSVEGQYGSRTLRQSQPRLGGRGLNAVAPDAGQASQAYPNDDEYLGLPGGNQGNAVAQPARWAQAGPRISIDPSLNAVIVRDRPENMQAYEGLVRALDIQPQVVQLEATIIDLNIEKIRDLGIDWRVQSQGFSALFGGDIGRRTGNVATDTLNNGAANEGLSLSSIIGAHQEFIGRISALEKKGAARIVSRPQLVTLSNVEAVFDRTQTFYVRVAGDRQVDLFNVTAGTVLRVNPHVLSDGGVPRIRMVIGVQDGSILEGRVDRIPVVENASVNTQALINEGESLLLGGLTVNSQFDAESKIPLLGDIPVLGELFKTRSRSARRIERLFLITPRIIRLDEARAVPASYAPAPAPAVPQTRRQ